MLSVPGSDTHCGRVLNILRAAGNSGVALKGILSKARVVSDKKGIVRVQSAIHGLRERGWRIDLDNGRYIFKGEGASFTRFSPGKEFVPVATGARSKRLKGQAKTTSRNVQAPVQHNTSVPTPSPTPAVQQPTENTLFTVNHQVVARAMATMPAQHRDGLRAFAKKAESYNAAFALYLKAEEELRGLLGGTAS